MSFLLPPSLPKSLNGFQRVDHSVDLNLGPGGVRNRVREVVLSSTLGLLLLASTSQDLPRLSSPDPQVRLHGDTRTVPQAPGVDPPDGTGLYHSSEGIKCFTEELPEESPLVPSRNDHRV